MAKLDIVGIAEVAALLGVNRSTVRSWQLRGHLPAPDAQLLSGPVWNRKTITAWKRSAAARTRLAA